ncbi:acylphosphatase [Actinacidiphila glaucinigra]|uniref:acylphosphatase n=1 Tax=Actinacidiphila glaucinigra TaxID=235986 RepID=UPI00340F8611
MIRRRVVVTGDVQGVYFRDTCRMTADGTGVAGWVRNRPDGTVEAVFEGPPGAVAEMVAWSHEGSPLSIVDRVEVVEEEPEGLTGFEIRPTPWRD